MNAQPAQLWTRFREWYMEFPSSQISLDLSRIRFAGDFFSTMAAPMERAFAEMAALEAGKIVNATEQRKVGHYWLRAEERAPDEFRAPIRETLLAVKRFANAVHTGRIRGEQGPFQRLLVVGIGGSALGPQFVANALGHPLMDRLEVRFLDNTDPDGIDRTLAAISSSLGRTLVVVISKSGSTPETRNGMLEVEAAYRQAGLRFPDHAVAITQFDVGKSELYAKAIDETWRATFPMWDWVGGRTSVTSAVGLLPAALQGIDIDGLLAGARACDEITRRPEVKSNPAALMALAWHSAGGGRGAKDMVILPYKDRLELFARYLQQLVMESLGKAKDRSDKVVHQGLAVYGNKGSTDQHAYVQQLRDGLNNFFAVFIRVLRTRDGASPEVKPGATSGDFLNGFLLGTRRALFENGRESITIAIPEVSAFTVGSLIALFERAVGFYASLVNVNAYDQPGVEAGKKAASDVLTLQTEVLKELETHRARHYSAESLAAAVKCDDPETVFLICQHLAANRSSVHQHGTGVAATFSA